MFLFPQKGVDFIKLLDYVHHLIHNSKDMLIWRIDKACVYYEIQLSLILFKALPHELNLFSLIKCVASWHY